MAIPAIVKVFIWALIPFLELRASIPLGVLVYKLSPALVVIASILPDILLAFVLLLVLKPISQWLSSKSKLFSFIFNWSSKKASLKTRKYLDKYGFIGLALFVGIPLPGTGVWTASLASYVLGIPFKRSFLAITLGCFIAGTAVLLVTLTGISFEKYFGVEALLGLIAIIAFGIITKNFFLKEKFKN
ncbi:small multi-drug export protein [Candidatus Parcubacteria bacterium]|nr:small multi-drug export protein [Candidatus Parcubacteria bacterium]